MDLIKTGVVGVGRLGRFHAQKHAANEKAEFVGVYDPDIKAAKKQIRKGTFLNVY